ncbi:MAG: pyridine nucleotide-disulfide oxidoreductase [Flavobacteriales bacterium]|nr:MAG: pyridine nucleotide-disulfide oxidoreductase [Flavobacteriales bacterium]
MKTDILIIGAGPAGTVAGAYLNKRGFKVVIIEKTKFPRFVIGESLLPISMEHFKEVDFLECLEKQNFEVKSGARFMRGKEVCLFDFSKKYTKGADWTWQVPRADFDKTLADEVEKRGVEILYEHEVVGVSFNKDYSSVTKFRDKKGNVKEISARFIVDASGYGQVLPRLLDLEVPSTLPKHSSIFTHLKDIKRPHGKEGTLISFDIVKPDVWLWVIPFSNGTTSIGFVGTTEFINSYKGTNEEVLREMLKMSDYYYDRFKDVAFSFEPHKIQNFSKASKQLYGNGYVLTGNSAEFLDPVFSSGVAFATKSSLLAAKLIDKTLKGEQVNWEKDYTEHIKKGVDVFKSYINEWYNTNLQKLFFHRPENPEVKEKICAVLAGYVWDETNPFVKKHNRAVASMAHMLGSE